MYSPFSEKDIILAFSEFASLMTMLKMLLKKLENDIEYHADHLGETNSTMFQTHGALERNLKSWMIKLQTHLQKFEFYNRVSCSSIHKNNVSLQVIVNIREKTNSRCYNNKKFSKNFIKTDRNILLELGHIFFSDLLFEIN